MRTQKEIRTVMWELNSGLASSAAKRAPEWENQALEGCVDLLRWVVGDPSRFERVVAGAAKVFAGRPVRSRVLRTQKEIRTVMWELNSGLASSAAKRAPEWENQALEACLDLLRWVVGDPSRFEREVIPVFERLRKNYADPS